MNASQIESTSSKSKSSKKKIRQKKCKSGFIPSRITFAAAIKRYPNRYTLEHIPSWATTPLFDKYYAPLYSSDKEWYDNTVFPEERENLPKNQCISKNFTYPIGKWLKQPYYIGMTKEEGGYEEPIDEYSIILQESATAFNWLLETKSGE
jgi:hypothetical protein